MHTRTPMRGSSSLGLSRTRTRQQKLARGVLDAEVSHHQSGWLRVDVSREWDVLDATFGVVGYAANYEPATTFTLLGPKERTVFVEPLCDDEVVFIKVVEPNLTDRRFARTVLHGLRRWYGEDVVCPDTIDCGCEFVLGTAWRWFEACEVEAIHFEPPQR